MDKVFVNFCDGELWICTLAKSKEIHETRKNWHEPLIENSKREHTNIIGTSFLLVNLCKNMAAMPIYKCHMRMEVICTQVLKTLKTKAKTKPQVNDHIYDQLTQLFSSSKKHTKHFQISLWTPYMSTPNREEASKK